METKSFPSSRHGNENISLWARHGNHNVSMQLTRKPSHFHQVFMEMKIFPCELDMELITLPCNSHGNQVISIKPSWNWKSPSQFGMEIKIADLNMNFAALKSFNFWAILNWTYAPTCATCENYTSERECRVWSITTMLKALRKVRAKELYSVYGSNQRCKILYVTS